MKIGFQLIFVFLLLKEKEKGNRKMITGISGYGFFVHNWPCRDAKLFAKKWVAETLIFKLFFGCALFWPSCQKGEVLDTHPKKEKFD